MSHLPFTAPRFASDRIRGAVGSPRRLLALAVTVLLLAGLAHAPAARAAEKEPFRPVTAKPVPVVPVEPVPTSPAATAAPQPSPAAAKSAPVWPAAGTEVIDLTAATRRAGTSPVRVGAPARPSTRAGTAPAKVRVEVLDRATTTRAGVQGVLVRLGRADGGEPGAPARVSVDYRSFATAYGADWSSRLRLVSLPACALTTPERTGCAATPLVSDNDLQARTVSADVAVGAAPTLIAASAGASGPAGDYSATPLKPTATWAVGGNTGSFTWTYPMRTPPALGGPAPQVGLSYSSQSVDGQHAASNNQPSWIGEGFEPSIGGFIERRYQPCGKDMDGSANNDKETGDLCWETDNAVLSLVGHSGELIYNAGEDRWHLRSDDGSRIERRTGGANGDDNGEHWVVTTTDGVQYWFGLDRLPGWKAGDPETNSTLIAPVFGNDTREPCHANTFADSDCPQAWRWNLDYVVDPSGNSTSYWYGKETNKYGRNMAAADDATYDRAAWLDRIDYGTRRIGGVDSVLGTPAPMSVDLAAADRCLSDCGNHDEAHWPDVPWESACSGASCPDKFSPTFWSTKRLSTITTRVRNGSGYTDVERWTLHHTFPDPGDGTRAGLWLDRLAHTGLVGGSASVPDVQFTAVQLANRVDTVDFAAAMNWMRITKIRTETGGTISVVYSAEDCRAGQPMPALHANTRRCYPVRWEPEGYTAPVTDWFHKYVVKTVYENDNTGGVPPNGSPRVVYTYDYLDGAAWHYNDDDGLIRKDQKTWSDYRGYGRVGITVGDPGEQTYTEMRYFRGMHGDRLAPTGTRDAAVDGIDDLDWYAGLTRETRVLNGPGGAVVQRAVNTPWASGATATRTVNGDTVTARFTRIGTVARHTTLDGGRGERVVKTVTGFDNLGMPVTVDDLGQDGVAGDEQCTRNDYTPRNTTAWIMDRLHRVQTYAVRCAATTGTLDETDIIGETRTSYDGHAFQTAPTRGLVTLSEEMSAWNGGSPTFAQTERKAYDEHGRAEHTWDALDRQTSVTFTPATDGPVTSTLTKNPLNHSTTTTMVPAWNLPAATVDPNGKRTDLGYDPLGRLRSVWAPGRNKDTQTPSEKFDYDINDGAPSVIATSQLNAAGAYVTTYELFDGLLRKRQSQQPSPSGGRLITEAFFDSAGRSVLAFDKYHTAGVAGGTLLAATDKAFVPRQTRTRYDGAGRATAEIFQPYGFERWRTATVYAGDRTDVTPPDGGTATSKVVDARDRTVQLRQYHGATPTPNTAGSWDATAYRYDARGHLTTVVDAQGNDWVYRYDIRGRQVEVDDPDKGLTVSTYDDADQLTSVTDARGKKVAYLYDPLGRKRAAYDNAVGGPLRAQWIYDTVQTGQLSQSTRMVGTAAYQYKVLDYTNSYQPGKTQVIIPSSETGLGGTYNFTNSYNIDDTVASVSVPGTNTDLPAETLTYGYSGLGQPTTLKTIFGEQNASYVENTIYNALGEIDQLKFYTGTGGRVFTSYQRELETGRLTNIRTDRDSVAPHLVADTHYTFDAAGNIIKAADTAPDPVDDTQCFGYDHLRRLTEAWTPAGGDCGAAPSTSALGGPAPYWQSWRFDLIGNRTQEITHTSAGDVSTGYTYPQSGAQSVRPHAVTRAGTGGYTYDAAGNMLTRPTPGAGTQSLTWDSEGHLETSADATGQSSYIYDADGNRLIRRDPTGRTLYLPGQEVRYNAATATTSCTRYYSFAGTTVASRTKTSLTWLSADHQGTSVVAVDAGTQQVVVRRQTPYGAPRGAIAAWPNGKGFVGGTMDATGLTHLGAREYDPALGRFISPDPVMDLLDPQQIHGYSYSNNSPVTLSDPTGLKFDDETGAEYAKRLEKHRQKEEQRKAEAKKKRDSFVKSLNNRRHNAAQRVARQRIREQVADMGGDPDMVVIEYHVDGACKTKSHRGQCGEAGKVDIVYIDEDTSTIYVWEVKILHRPMEAANDVKHYMRKIKATGEFDNVRPGFALKNMAFAAVPGTTETVVVYNGPTEGAVLYRAFRWREPKGTPPPTPAPERVRVPEPAKPNYTPYIVGGVGATVVVAGLAGLCILATAGVCGAAIGGGLLAGGLAASTS